MVRSTPAVTACRSVIWKPSLQYGRSARQVEKRWTTAWPITLPFCIARLLAVRRGSLRRREQCQYLSRDVRNGAVVANRVCPSRSRMTTAECRRAELPVEQSAIDVGTYRIEVVGRRRPAASLTARITRSAEVIDGGDSHC